MKRLLRTGVWMGLGLALLMTALAVLLVVSPRQATQLREWGNLGSALFSRLDAQGMTELIAEEQSDLAAKIQETKLMLELLGENNPSLAEGIRMPSAWHSLGGWLARQTGGICS